MRSLLLVVVLAGGAVAQAPATRVVARSQMMVTPRDPQAMPVQSGERQTRGTVHEYIVYGSVYSGYDVVLEPQADPAHARVSFRPLSLSAEELGLRSVTFLAPERLPDPRVVGAGDSIAINPLLRLEEHEVVALVTFLLGPAPLTRDEIRSQGIADHMLIPHSRMITPEEPSSKETMAELEKIVYRKQCEQSWANRFSAADSVLCIVKPQVRVSGVLEALLVSGESHQRVTEMLASEGGLRWFYVPGGGRYVYALAPRPGLAQAGEVVGSEMKLNLDGRQVVLESAVPLTPGGGAYPVYARHEADWQPEEDRDLDRMLLGTLP